jgi:hypothetical protein
MKERMIGRLISIFFLMVVLYCSLGAFRTMGEQRRRASRYLIPKGYVGWVKIDFQIKGAAPLPIEEGFYLFQFPADGKIKTSSGIEYGAANDEYYYFAGENREKLTVSGWGAGGMVWGQFNGNSQGLNNQPLEIHEYFFIGSEEQFKRCGAEKDEQYHPKVGPMDPAVLIKCEK